METSKGGSKLIAPYRIPEFFGTLLLLASLGISGSRSGVDQVYGLCNAHGHGTHWAHLAILGIFTGKNGESQYAGDITLKYTDQEARAAAGG